MRYGKSLKEFGTIGVVDPSFGCNGYPYLDKTKNAIKILESKGYKVKTADELYDLDISNLLNNDYKKKAKSLMEFYLDKDIDVLISVAGGELMNKTIEDIDFNILKNSEPKLFMGFSDNTWLTFLLPTICDVASIYGYNFTMFGMNDYHKSVSNHLDILKGNIVDQESFDSYQLIDLSKTPSKALDGLNLDSKTSWQTLNNEESLEFRGRIIGGCLEVLNLIIGSKYDNVENFNNKYLDDGFIWYFENCEMNILDQLRSYKHFINSNWIKNCKGILIGRTINKEEICGISYIDMLHECFDSLNIPVIYDVDIGHLDPAIAIINGSIAEVKYSNKKGTIKQYLI